MAVDWDVTTALVAIIGVAFGVFVAPMPSHAQQPPSMTAVGGMVQDDFKYLVDNVPLDFADVVTSPLYFASPNSVLRSPKFYLVLAGAGAVWGTSFALDQSIRSHLREMSSSDADLLQNLSYGTVSGGTALLYLYGLYSDDARARQYALTAGESAGVASLVDIGVKAAFGRLRPHQDGHSHTAFFDGGQSFVSGDVTPMFALAAGISEYFNNQWYIAAPIYSLALLDGFGRMGHDAHWFSDVVGAALLGWGTTELLLYLHKQHEEQPDRWRIFPVSPPASPTSSQAIPGLGLGLSYNW
jgi:membrane-associated phospholipid phosphatase